MKPDPRLSLCLLGLFSMLSCRTPPETGSPPDPVTRQRLGLVERVNFAEKYLVFTASRPFTTGEILDLWREGQVAGRVRVLSPRRGSLQTGDILEGVPEAGDVLQRPGDAQSQGGHQGQSRGFGP